MPRGECGSRGGDGRAASRRMKASRPAGPVGTGEDRGPRHGRRARFPPLAVRSREPGPGGAASSLPRLRLLRWQHPPPPPFWMVMKPESSRIRNASRTDCRPTLNCCASSVSGGSLSPGLKTPSKMSFLILLETSSNVRGLLIGVNTALGVDDMRHPFKCLNVRLSFLLRNKAERGFPTT